MHLPSTIKKAFVLCALLVAVKVSGQQHSAGINTNNPNPNAVLHLVSTNGNQGLLIPQIGTTQRLNMDLSDPDNNGLLVYDNDEGEFYYAHGGDWYSLTDDADADPSNEIQTISKSGNTISLSGNNSSVNIGEGTPTIGQFLEWDGTNWVPVTPPTAQQLQFAGNMLSISNDPTSTTVDFSLWDQVAGDDFDGDYNSLTNQPAIPSLTSELTNDSGFITSADDADADVTNEIQTITKAGNTLTLSVNNSSVNIGEGTPTIGQFLEWDGTNWVPVTPPTAQELQYSGSILSLTNDPSSTTIDFSLWDQVAGDDFDGDYNSLINQPSIPSLTSELTNDSGFITSADDADADATNEIQNVTGGVGITVTPSGNDFQIDNASPDQTVTLADGGSGNVTIGGTYPAFTVDVPSLDDADADATNEIQNVTGGVGITVTPSGNDFQIDNASPDQTVTLADGGSGNVTIGGTYPAFTVDVPSLDDADADATNEIQNVTGGVGITVTPSGNDFQIDNASPDQTVTLADGGSGNVTIGGTYPAFTVDVPSLDDADADATNEIQNVTAGVGITVTPSGNDFQIDNASPDQTVTLTDGGSGNVTIGGTYPAFTVDVPSLDDADADATNEIQNVTAGVGITVTPSGNDFQIDNASPDQTVTLTDGGSGNVTIGGTYPAFTVDVPSLDDADADATNEIQNVTAGVGITVTPSGNDFQIDNSSPDQTVTLTDGGSGNVTIGGTYPAFTVDVPSLDDADADATNEIQNVTAGVGITVTPSGNDFQIDNASPDQTVTLADGGSGNVTIGGTYPAFTVDVPSLDDADADATNEIQNVTGGVGITVTPSGNDFQIDNASPDQTVTLADGGSGNVTIGGTYPAFTVDVPSLDDADADATNEIQNVTAGVGITVTPSGNDFQIDNALPDQTVTLADGGSGNVTIGGTYPNLTVDVSSLDDADADATNEIQDLSLAADHTLSLSLSAATANLAPYMQTLSFTNPNLTISGVGGNTVDLSALNTDDQTVDQFNLTGNTLNLSLEDDGVAPYTVDLSQYAFPDQTGQNGNYLTTDGTNLSWDPLGALAQLDAVTTTEITDNTITGSDLNASVAGNGLSGAGGSPIAVNLSGTSGLQITTDQLEMPDLHPPGGGTWGVVLTGSIDYDRKGRITGFGVSDERLKTDITRIEGVLDRTVQLNGYTYYYKNQPNDMLQHGVIAQELKELFPALVMENEKGYYSVNFGGLVPILLEALKEQHAIVQDLESRLDSQERINKSQESRISDIESKLDHLLQIGSISE